MLCIAEPGLRRDGVAIATSHRTNIDDAVADICAAIPSDEISLLVVYFGAGFDAGRLATSLSEAFPGVELSGCSTAGEITPEGYCEETIVAMGFAKNAFSVVTRCLTGLSDLSMCRTREVAAEALRELHEERARMHAEDEIAERTFALMLTDGMSHVEEQLVCALSGSLLNIPLIGGSAADGLNFRKTQVIHGNRAYSDASVVALISCKFPLMAFSCCHFSPTPVKLVVTSADVNKRIVRELNGAPAASEYAAAVGLSGQPLSPKSFAAHPVAVRVGGGYYVRSIQQVNPDGSLSFLCAIDEGIVLSLAQTNDIVASAERTFEKVQNTIGKPSVVLGFECVLRRVAAELQQADRRLSDIYRRNNVVGFHTYGEQFKTLHVNQTFSGIAIGR